MSVSARHRADWETVATILRSQCHASTWIGHVPGAGHVDTPAGPLRVVKAAVIDDTDVAAERYRWKRHDSGDGYDLEVNYDPPPPRPRRRTGRTSMRWGPAGPA